MNNNDLIAALQADIASSTGGDNSDVAIDRAEAMDYYMGELFGNEVEGRSEVVTSEVSDTIEWILPQLLKVFGSTDEVVVFDPVSPEDEEAAKQETDYVNYIFYKDNNGFEILYSWFKDALLSKNGVVKYWYEDNEEVVHEDYMGLTQDEYTLLVSDDNIEVTGVEETVSIDNPEPVINVNITRKINNGKIKVMVVPPEEFIIDAEYTELDLQDVTFCGHETVKTISQLRSEGVDEKILDKLAAGDDERFSEPEYLARFKSVSSSMQDDDESNDPSMRKVKITECIKRVDYDGDGYAELRKITLANEHYILDNEEIGYVPYVAITPIPMTHRFFGRSVADLVMDLQKIKSTLLRNILDNLYLINNTRTAVVDGEVNLDDLLDSRPGGVVRMTAPGMASPLATQPFTGHAFGMLEYIDTLRENRTGVTRYSQGMDSNSLNKTATGIEKIMSASQERVHLIARIFGEGLKRLLMGVHRLALQNMDREKLVRMRNKWIPVNPSEWKERENMSVSVGLGTGDKDKQAHQLGMILQIQKEAAMSGFTDYIKPEHILYTFKKLIEASGRNDAQMFFADPESVQPSPPQPDAQEQMIQLQGQIEAQKAQIESQKVQLDAQQQQIDAQFKDRELTIREQDLMRKFEQDKVKAAQNAQSQMNDIEKAQLNAAVDLQKTELGHNSSMELKRMDGVPDAYYDNELRDGVQAIAGLLVEQEGKRKIDKAMIKDYLAKKGSPDVQLLVNNIGD
jgi:hypothetical protein